MSEKVIILFTVFFLLILIYGQSFEGFANPTVASAMSTDAGSSDYYNWGYKDVSPEMEDKIPHTRHHCPSCRKSCYIPVPYTRQKYPCPHCSNNINIKNNFFFIKEGDCNKCDIAKSRDISKYVLKTSVPACPDMAQYVKKSQMMPSPGLPPSSSNCPKCPICPICPKCPGTNGGSGAVNTNAPITSYNNSYSGSYNLDTSDWAYNLNGDDGGGDIGPGYRTGGIPITTGNDIGNDQTGTPAGTTPRGGNVPQPYFKDFAYNNRSTGRVRPYNSIWSLFK